MLFVRPSVCLMCSICDMRKYFILWHSWVPRGRGGNFLFQPSSNTKSSCVLQNMPLPMPVPMKFLYMLKYLTILIQSWVLQIYLLQVLHLLQSGNLFDQAPDLVHLYNSGSGEQRAKFWRERRAEDPPLQSLSTSMREIINTTLSIVLVKLNKKVCSFGLRMTEILRPVVCGLWL